MIFRKRVNHNQVMKHFLKGNQNHWWSDMNRCQSWTVRGRGFWCFDFARTCGFRLFKIITFILIFLALISSPFRFTLRHFFFALMKLAGSWLLLLQPFRLHFPQLSRKNLPCRFRKISGYCWEWSMEPWKCYKYQKTRKYRQRTREMHLISV